MRNWLKRIFKEAAQENQRDPQSVRANRSPTEDDTSWSVGTQWEDPSNKVWILKGKKSIWVVDLQLSQKAKEMADARFKSGNYRFNTINNGPKVD